MATEELKPRSRRALLAAAAGAVGALAANAAMPLTAAAIDPNDVSLGAANFSGGETSINQQNPYITAFRAWSVQTGAAGLVGSTGDQTNIATNTSFTGVYGWAPSGQADEVGAGVWGDSDDIGVFGSGSWGVYGYGSVGVIGESASTAHPGVIAYGANATSPALQVVGKVIFNRSGRKAMSSGNRSKTVTLSGVTSTSKVFAVLATSESGRWVRAVVPAAGKFTIYLNTTLTSSAVVSWFVLD